MLTKYLNGAGIDNKLRVQTGSDVKYFLTDHLGSTNGLVDLTGNVTATNSYDSFGNSSNANFPTRYQFTGREYDSFTGLHYYRARFYDANLGRFISEDPIGFAGGDVNLYGYVKNKPLKYRNPRGLDDADLEFENRIKSPRPTPNPWYWSHNEGADNTDLPTRKWVFSYNFGCPNSGLGIGAFGDFWGNYSDMRNANTVGADKFFHCMANCQAARRGSLGSGLAGIISEGRELFDENIKGDSRQVCDEDRLANDTGRGGGEQCRPCENVCAPFQPRGLTYPMPVLPPMDNCGKYGNWRCK